MELRIFSFFSGAGFLDLGFEKEKYEVVFVNEYSNEFLKAYKFAREKMGMKSPRLIEQLDLKFCIRYVQKTVKKYLLRLNK